MSERKGESMGEIEAWRVKQKTAKIRGKEVSLGKSLVTEKVELDDDCFTDGVINEKGIRKVNELGGLSLPNFKI